MPKRIRIPPSLLIKEQFAKWNNELGTLEGETEFDISTLTKWKYELQKGGWQYQGSMSDNLLPTHKSVEIPDTQEESDQLPEDPVLTGIHRIEEGMNRGFSDVKALASNQWIYTMLSRDNTIIKIGETRETGDVQKYLIDRYKGRGNGGPYSYIDHKEGTREIEVDYHTYLQRVCDIQPLSFNGKKTKEYYPAREALEALRRRGGWPLGILESITPDPIFKPDQGELEV